MPSARTQPTKSLFSNQKTKITLLAALALVVLYTGLTLGQYAAQAFVANKLPEVAKFYDAETREFPGYNVSTVKNWMATPEGTQISYVVTLQAGHQATLQEMSQAGKTACAAGLPEDTIVTVSARKQYWILPFYTYQTISGHCPKAQS
jgi:hypothetical protein